MSTSLWSTPIDHTSNAGFQAWASELFTQLTTVNVSQFTQTADTGQLATPVVAARPGTSTMAGYWIFKWDDGTSTPLYFKIEVGTGSGASTPAIAYTVGTSTNGSGTLGGAVTTRTTLTVNQASSSAVTNFTSYLCIATGGFGLIWKATGSSTTAAGMGFMAVARSIDDSGIVNNDGYLTTSISNSSATFFSQSVNLSNNVVFTTSASNTLANTFVFLAPLTINSSIVGSDAQYFRCFAAYPLGRPLGHLVAVLNSEFSQGTSFNGESGSITDHTFLSGGVASKLSIYAFAILWE